MASKISSKICMQNMDMNYNHIFMTILLFIGLILIGISWNIDSNLSTTNCKSYSLKTANKFVMIIGVMFFTSSICFFGCTSKCSTVIKEFNFMIYVLSMFVLGVILIILGSIISAQSNSVAECSTADATSIWVLGLLIVLTCVGYTGYKYKKNM